MNTPTPRTDAALQCKCKVCTYRGFDFVFLVGGGYKCPKCSNTYIPERFLTDPKTEDVVLADFARQLERELVEAKSDLHKLMERAGNTRAERDSLERDRDEWQAIAEKLSEIPESTLARFNAKKVQQ